MTSSDIDDADGGAQSPRHMQDRLSRVFGADPAVSSQAFKAGWRESDINADLAALANLWGLSSRASNGMARPGQVKGSRLASPAAGPASIALEAEKLGLGVDLTTSRLAAWPASDMPCIVLLASGGSSLVLSRGADGTLKVLVEGEVIEIAQPTLEALASGTIVRVHPAAESATTTPNPTIGATATATRADIGVFVSRLKATVLGQRSLLLQLMVASVTINIFGMLMPLFSMAVFDRVIPHAAIETLWALALGVGIALCMELLVRNARLKLFDAAGQSISHDLQGHVMGRLLGGKAAHLPTGSAAMVQPMQEVESMSHLAPQLVTSVLVDLPFFVVLLCLIAFIGGPIVFAPLVGALALVAIHLAGHRLAHHSHEMQGGLVRKQQQAVIDAITAREHIRITGAGPDALARWDVTADAAGYAAHRARYWHGLAAQTSAVLTQLVMVATLVIGVYRIDAALMTIGALSASLLLVNRAMMPVAIATGLIFRTFQILQTAAPVSAVMAADLERGGDQHKVAAEDILGQIDVSKVSFAYPGEQRQALREVSFAIRPGERVGIIGKAGCGKSTLLRLLVQLHESQTGRLCLDGRDVRQYDPATLRRAVTYMPQDSHLIDGTLEENLLLGLRDVPRPTFERISRLAGVHEFASLHPLGYSLQVGPGGRRLSGGERQCVALARALMGTPKLLLLDEPTAALDNTAEARLISEIKRELGATGLVVATHRLAVLALVDRIIWMDNGQIVLDGPKAEVFSKLGVAA